MSEECLPLSTTSPEPRTDASYEAIYAELMRTERGRHFLLEYARRNFRADAQSFGAIDATAASARVGAEEKSTTRRPDHDMVSGSHDAGSPRVDIDGFRPLPRLGHDDSLAAVLALSDEELIALFS
jgi:hypothetical protein